MDQINLPERSQQPSSPLRAQQPYSPLKETLNTRHSTQDTKRHLSLPHFNKTLFPPPPFLSVLSLNIFFPSPPSLPLFFSLFSIHYSLKLIYLLSTCHRYSGSHTTRKIHCPNPLTHHPAADPNSGRETDMNTPCPSQTYHRSLLLCSVLSLQLCV